MYKPPFTISSRIINLIASISAQIERYAIRMEQGDSLRLRKVNRLKTIHSSLAIEGNNLSENEVLAIIEGKNVIAPQKEILEVRNAIKTYELYPKLNPYAIDDMLKAHTTMMSGLIADAGRFRKGGVGVYDGKRIIHMAPPAERVEELMRDLFNWLETSEDHLLIKSCVFHYEFEFIHPFADGNGRIGRLWQSLILGKLNSLFEHLPVENMVYANQEAYYKAIAQSSNIADSRPFIEFMLHTILDTLQEHKGVSLEDIVKAYSLQDNELKILGLIRNDKHISAKKISEQLALSPRQVERILANLRNLSIVKRIGANRNGFWEVISKIATDN